MGADPPRPSAAAVGAVSDDGLDGLVGLKGDPFELVVERGKIREFAAATHSNHPAYLDGADPVVPPTFFASAAHWAPYEETLLERTGWDRRRMLHAAQEYAFPGPPPCAGARLRGRAVITEAYEKPGRRGGMLRFLVITTDFVGDRGEVVAVSKTTVVATSQPPGDA